MKKLAALWILAASLVACQKSEVVSEYTGNEATYALQQASGYNVSGSITFRERKDGKVYALIQLSGTNADTKHPVHLHLGDISVQGADVALLLSPVAGTSGRSETIISQLADETPLNYQQLIKLNACIKIHLASTGAAKDVVLVAGNIGAATTAPNIGGRGVGVAECKSE